MLNEEIILVSKCLKGDQRAMKQVYDQHKAVMYSLCLRYAKDASEAQDFLQDGFVKAFADMGQFQGTGPLGGWLRRVMVHSILQDMRRRKIQFVETEINTLADLHQSNDDIFSRFREKVILAMVQALPDGFRLVFNMYVMEGYSHKEIAEQLGITESTSKSQLSRAKESLRKMLEREYH